MYEHEKRALRLVRRKLGERGVTMSPEEQLEVAMMALQRETFFYALDACVDWAIEVATKSRSSAA